MLFVPVYPSVRHQWLICLPARPHSRVTDIFQFYCIIAVPLTLQSVLSARHNICTLDAPRRQPTPQRNDTTPALAGGESIFKKSDALDGTTEHYVCLVTWPNRRAVICFCFVVFVIAHTKLSYMATATGDRDAWNRQFFFKTHIHSHLHSTKLIKIYSENNPLWSAAKRVQLNNELPVTL